jgi:hypothetical protein
MGTLVIFFLLALAHRVATSGREDFGHFAMKTFLFTLGCFAIMFVTGVLTIIACALTYPEILNNTYKSPDMLTNEYVKHASLLGMMFNLIPLFLLDVIIQYLYFAIIKLPFPLWICHIGTIIVFKNWWKFMYQNAASPAYQQQLLQRQREEAARHRYPPL